MIATLTDCCPRCGYVLDQPAPPTPPVSPPPPPVLTYAAPYPAPAPPPRPAPGGLSAASVPKILLGLGATCLLVAAAIFLAVAWSWLGVGGRTAVLVGLTLATALGGQWLLRRDLGVAAESLTVVALGLVVMDLVGARDAGWLGTPTIESFVGLTGWTLLAVSLGLCLPRRRLFTPQVTAPLALGTGLLGVAPPGHDQTMWAVAIGCFAALTVLGRLLGAVVLPWTSGSCALLSGLAFAVLAAGDATANPSWHALWVEGHGVGMLGVAGLVLLPWPLAPRHDDLRQLVVAVSASVLTCTAVLPVLDEGPTAVTLTAAASSVLWALVAAATPPRWYAVPRVPMLGSLLVLVPVPCGLVAQGVGNLLRVGPVFSSGWDVRLQPEQQLANPLLVPLAVAVVGLAAALTVPRTGRFGWALLGLGHLTVLVTAAQYAVPLALFVAALGPLGFLVAFPSAVLSLVALAEVTLLAAYVVLRHRGDVAVPAALVLPAALAAFLWTGGHVVAAPFEFRSLVTLTALGLLALAVPRPELEVTAAATVLGVSMLGIAAAGDLSVSAAIHLTLAGAIVTTSALLRPDHRPLAWLGGFLLASATWVRLWDVGVHAPEAYTLPTAIVLVLVGLYRLHRDPAAGTTPALLPGLALATVPSLLWALTDAISTRATVLGLACLVLLLAGTALRWTAPVLVGWLVGGLLVLRELAPYAAHTPQWVLIGTAGSVLIGVGITWEARLRDLRQAAGYLGRLR